MIFTSLGQKIIVRYARKPIWMATAPSKLFRIAEHTFYSPEEIVKIRELHKTYRAQEAALREYMKHQFYIPATQSGGLPQELIDKERIEDMQRFKENEEENARIAKIREEAINKQMKDLENKVMEAKISKEEDLLQTAQELNDYVEEQVSNPRSFVTADNIDAVIEDALENPVCYEFFIDKSGGKHVLKEERNARGN